VPPENAPARLDALTVDDFLRCVGESFSIEHETGSLALRLAAAEAAPTPPGARRSFSAIWIGPPAPLLAQGMRRVEHPTLGVLEIFLVPIGADAHGARYEAVFG
jgi:hypothetical protein